MTLSRSGLEPDTSRPGVAAPCGAPSWGGRLSTGFGAGAGATERAGAPPGGGLGRGTSWLGTVASGKPPALGGWSSAGLGAGAGATSNGCEASWATVSSIDCRGGVWQPPASEITQASANRRVDISGSPYPAAARGGVDK